MAVASCQPIATPVGAMAAGQSVELLGAEPAHLDAHRHELTLGGHSGSVELISFVTLAQLPPMAYCSPPDPALGLVSLAVASSSAAFSMLVRPTLATTGVAHLDALGYDLLVPGMR